MATDPKNAKPPDAFASGLAFAIALLPVLALVGLLFPDGSDCAPDAENCGFWLARYFALGKLQALAVILGGFVTLIWLVLGLRYVFRRLKTMPRDRARNALFFYAILTCAAFFLLLPMAIVTVLIVAVCGEIVLRLNPIHGADDEAAP